MLVRAQIWLASIILLLGSGPTASGHDRLSFRVMGVYAVEQPFHGHASSDVRLGFVEMHCSSMLLHTDRHPRLQISSGLMLGESFRPGNRFVIGLHETARLTFAPRQRISMYGELGAGFMQSAVENALTEIDGRFQYVLLAGGGVRIRNERRGALLIGYRFIHFSNHDTIQPNYGLNMHSVILGYETPLF
jgi:lipid A 3-O-deacylase PagL